MSSLIKTGLLAYGMSGRVFHAPFLTAENGFELVAVVERHEKKAADRYPGVRSYDDVEAILADKDLELIIVNTPNFTHYEFAKQALLAGKHVLIEKPAAATVAESKELFDLGRAVERHVLVYQNRRWDSDFGAVKQVIESGRLGQLIEVYFRFDRYKPVLSPKFFKEDPNLAANGLMYDLGPHLIDQAISLFGNPLSFLKTTGTYRDQSQVVDYFNLHLSYPHQLNVYLTSGLLIAQPLPAFVVHGTLGTFIKDRVDTQEGQLDKAIAPTDSQYGIEPEGVEGKLITFGPTGEKETEPVPSLKGNYGGLFKAVHHTIRENALFAVTEEHITWQLEMLEA